MNRFIAVFATTLGLWVGLATAQDPAQDQDLDDAIAYAAPTSATTTTISTTVTNVTGTIKQLNYGSGGQVEGFLTGTNVRLSFGPGVCNGVGTLGIVGHSVTYSGSSSTTSTGFQSVRVTSFKNNTTGGSYTAPTTTSTFAAYGPTTGTIKQLNYATDGSIDGFLFTAGSSTVFVSIGRTSVTTLSSLLTVGTSLSVIGTALPAPICPTTGTISTVSASSLTVGGTTVVFRGGPRGR